MPLCCGHQQAAHRLGPLQHKAQTTGFSMFSLLPLEALTLSNVFLSAAADGGVTTSMPLAVWWSPSWSLVCASACMHVFRYWQG